MNMTAKRNPESLDEIDWEILRLLAADPRRPYSNISEKLRERGYEMSGEGIRYRVEKIFDMMSIFFMLHPNEQDWEPIIFLINVNNEPGAKERVAEELFGGKFWFVSRGFGSFDIYAIATAATTADIEELITDVRGYDHVANVDYLIETHRELEISNYFPIRNLD